MSLKSKMPNKEVTRVQATEMKTTATVSPIGSNVKTAVVTAKACVVKTNAKESAMSPSGPSSMEDESTELLGSLTTQQQQRTSARVIKKLRLEPPAGDKRDIPECETPIKIDEKDPLKFPTVKQRMPKALWSTDEKSLFFEALNEYGKDFDAITAYICAKMKKKGMPDVNLKTKTQVSHFYYRTWHKLSKHVHFDENVKKVAQELYALINYGELRKKLVSVNEKTCARLGEMVLGGSIMVRARGRNLRVRTPMCRALRKLNQISERACGVRVWSRAQVVLRARDAASWARVQAAAHNPRAAAALHMRVRLADFINALHLRWRPAAGISTTKAVEPITQGAFASRILSKHIIDITSSSCWSMYKIKRQPRFFETKDPEEELSVEKYESPLDSPRPQPSEDKDDEKEDLEGHLNLEPDRIILEEQKLPKKPVLHVGPKPSAEIHLPVVSPSEQLSSQKICFSSYLERMCLQRQDKEGVTSKIRAPKRQRKDSATEKDKEVDQKKIKVEEIEPKLMDIDETAVDGIELMANFKIQFEDEEKPSTEDEKDPKAEETAEEEMEREKDMSEKEKDSFSEMEDDEKYNKSDSDNESDHGKTDKSKRNTKFKNLKVKFRIRPKKRGGSIYTLVTDKESEDVKTEEPVKIEEESKADIDVETALKQIRKGWSVYDAGDLTIGDLYLMFGSRSKLELDYWWAEPTPPLPRPITKTQKIIEPDKLPIINDKDRSIEKKEKVEKAPEKGTDSSVEDDKEKARESDTDIFSPKNTSGQDSNDGMSGDERKGEQLASPEHKLSSSGCGTLKLASKLINRPQPQQKQDGFSMISSRYLSTVKVTAALSRTCRTGGTADAGTFNKLATLPLLQRLLALVGNPYVTSGSASATISRCNCGHVCSQQRKQKPQAACGPAPVTDAVFRHPTPIAPKAEGNGQKRLALDGLPRYRRGRPRSADRQVVVQRLLPLLPKLPLTKNLVPVKMVPNSPAAPIRILPKPSPPHVSNSSHTYILSESNGQYFFHDGDRRVPITPMQDYSDTETQDENTSDELEINECKIEVTSTEVVQPPEKEVAKELKLEAASDISVTQKKSENSDIANFLPSESLSLSPSRLLRESDGWLEGSVQDFSLSSFLGHLEGRPQPYLGVDSHLQSLMAESSVDYVAKFADLAAEVSDEITPLAEDLT